MTELANYNTSICMMGLLAARDSRHDAVLRKARAFVASQQADLGERGKMDTPWDGGIGYSHDAGRSDMNNTLTALEAIYYTKHLVADKDLPEKSFVRRLRRQGQFGIHGDSSRWSTLEPINPSLIPYAVAGGHF